MSHLKFVKKEVACEGGNKVVALTFIINFFINRQGRIQFYILATSLHFVILLGRLFPSIS